MGKFTIGYVLFTKISNQRILVLSKQISKHFFKTFHLQETIKAQFKECTVLTIAHRLNTIIDYDRVMVLSDGLIKEFDNPHTLMNDPTTQFHAMAVDAGLVQKGAGSANGSSGSNNGSQHEANITHADVEINDENSEEGSN